MRQHLFSFFAFCVAIVNSRRDKRCRVTTWPCQLLQPGQKQSPFTPVLWPAQVVAAGRLLQASSSQPPLHSSSPAPQPVAADAPQHCGAAPRHQRKRGLDDPTGVPYSSPSCAGNVAAFSCTWRPWPLGRLCVGAGGEAEEGPGPV